MWCHLRWRITKISRICIRIRDILLLYGIIYNTDEQRQSRFTHYLENERSVKDEFGFVLRYMEDKEDETGIMKIFSQLTGEAARVFYGDEIYEQRKFVEAFKHRTGVQALTIKTNIR